MTKRATSGKKAAKKASSKSRSVKRSRELKVFTLKLSKWLRGNRNETMLYNSRLGKYCCLGQFGRQCGISAANMKGIFSPKQLDGKLPDDYRQLIDGNDNSQLAYDAMEINDDPDSKDRNKIAKLRPIFRKLGYRIEVVP